MSCLVNGECVCVAAQNYRDKEVDVGAFGRGVLAVDHHNNYQTLINIT